MDAYIEHDVRTAIDTVIARTGESTRLHWVGHSMGSMVLYGYISRFGDEKLRLSSAWWSSSGTI